jgi:hypothetical protein
MEIIIYNYSNMSGIYPPETVPLQIATRAVEYPQPN